MAATHGADGWSRAVGGPRSGYRPRVVDGQMERLLGQLPAVSIEGPRAVGKTRTARRWARTVYDLDDPATLALMTADPQRLVSGAAPVLIDEWQRFPASWDIVRRAVDDDPAPGRFLLTGSTAPEHQPDPFRCRSHRHSADAAHVPHRARHRDAVRESG